MAFLTSPAPWKNIIKSLITEHFKTSNKMQPMQLSTFDSSTNRPSNRSVIFRGFLSKQSKHNDDDNDYDPTIETDLLIIATDIRTKKVEQILKNPGYEICWWFPSTNNQLRLSGNAYIIHPTRASSSYTQLASTHLLPSNFNWEQERVKHWQKFSFEIKHSFYAAIPEKPPGGKIMIDKVVDDEESVIATTNTEKTKLKESIEKVTDPKVHENMCLIILEVDEVDRLELSVWPNKRTKWHLVKDNDDNKIKWIEAAIYP